MLGTQSPFKYHRSLAVFLSGLLVGARSVMGSPKIVEGLRNLEMIRPKRLLTQRDALLGQTGLLRVVTLRLEDAADRAQAHCLQRLVARAQRRYRSLGVAPPAMAFL